MYLRPLPQDPGPLALAVQTRLRVARTLRRLTEGGRHHPPLLDTVDRSGLQTWEVTLVLCPPPRPTPVSLDMQSARPQGVQGLLRQAGHCSAPHSSTRRGRLTAAFLQKLADTCTAVSSRAGGGMRLVTSWVVFLSVKWMEQDTLLLLSPPPQEREQRDQAPGDQDSECSEEAGWGVVSWTARGAEGRRTYLLDLSSDSSVVSSSSTCSEVLWESSGPRGRK